MRRLALRGMGLFLPAAAVLLAALLGVYAVGQQQERQGANEIPATLASDAARQLDAGSSPDSLTSALPAVDIASSLQAWLAVYDRSGHPIASSGRLDGELPQLPLGVLESARSGEDRVTWQPRLGVRQATVVIPYGRGYVAGGRSLREVEARIDRLGVLVGTVAAAGLVLVGAASLAGAAVLEAAGR